MNTNFVDDQVTLTKEVLDKGLKDKRLDEKFAVVLSFVEPQDDTTKGRGRRHSVLSQILTKPGGSNDNGKNKKLNLDEIALYEGQEEQTTISIPPKPSDTLCTNYPSLDNL